MTHEPQATGITVVGTELSEEETAALLTVVNTQLINTGPADPSMDQSTRHRVISTWADFNTWHTLPPGH